MDVPCHRLFLTGTSLEPAVIPYYYYYYYYYYHHNNHHYYQCGIHHGCFNFVCTVFQNIELTAPEGYLVMLVILRCVWLIGFLLQD